MNFIKELQPVVKVNERGECHDLFLDRLSFLRAAMLSVANRPLNIPQFVERRRGLSKAVLISR